MALRLVWSQPHVPSPAARFRAAMSLWADETAQELADQQNHLRHAMTIKPLNAEKPALTHARLLDVLSYDPLTGLFTWLKSTSGRKCIGNVAGNVNIVHGRRQIRIDGRLYFAARLAFLYVNCQWPEGEIDHRDADKLNDRIDNLRDVPGYVNRQNHVRPYSNNKAGVLGVVPAVSGRFHATIRASGKQRHLGTFDTAEAAHGAYVDKKRELHEGCTL
jgi:hypothetical protein